MPRGVASKGSEARPAEERRNPIAAVADPVHAEPGPVLPPRGLVLLGLGVAGCAAAAAALAFALTNPAIGAELGEPLVIAILADWITLSYVLCGLVAWWRRPDNRFGPLMIIAGFVNFLTSLSWTTNDLTYTLGQSLDLVPPVLFLHVFLAYPTGRLNGRFERALVLTGYATAISLELVRMFLGGFGPLNLIEVTSAPDAAATVTRVQLGLVASFCLVGVGILAGRRWRAGRPLRRSRALLVDAFGLALLMIATLFLLLISGGPAVPEVRWATFVTLGLAPLAFLVGLLDARLARTALGDLVLELREDPPPAVLRDALASTLRDPSLTLAYWLPEYGTWADVDGRAVDLADLDDSRPMRLIEKDGTKVAALYHDPALLDEPELLDAVTAAAGIALENGRLHAELRARLEELRGSRVRVIEAGQEERQRLERDLHDGAQQRLIALSLELGRLEGRLNGDSEARKRLQQARREVATSLEELRAVARGLHPAVVSGHGLAVALESLAARALVPVRLTVDVKDRLPEGLEVAAFYLVSESLANIGKHANATCATVDVSHTDGEVVVEIVDDGVGGADTEGGTGLRGLADRVEALDGRLRVWSPIGGGTRLRAEIPCAQ